MSTYLFTGFPGFLGSALLPRVLERNAEAHAVCLVQGKYERLARFRLTQICLAHPELESRVRLVEGDITLPDLGLGDEEAVVAAATTEIYHLAAIYDLTVSRDIGHRINVQGTRHLLRFAARCPGLTRFHQVSTCYVSGRHHGIFSEDDLDKGQTFNNHYEETKFLAEVEVQERMDAGLPATVYRPSIVVGDSGSGETQKYDGPYYVLRWLLRQPGVAVLPVVGDPHRTRLNVVPRDYVIDALATLSGLSHSVGRVYQLADPDPPTVHEAVEQLARATGRRLLRVRLSKRLARWAIEKVPGVYRIVQIPGAALDYFDHPTHYSTFHASTDLEGTGISVPRFERYVGRLVEYVRAHPEIRPEGMS